MIFQEIVISAPGEDGLQVREISINLEKVYLIHKQPLEPLYNIFMEGLNLQTVTVIPEQNLKVLVKFETPDGMVVFVNPKSILFLGQAEIGQYVMAYPGGAQIVLQTTKQELVEKLDIEETGRIII